MCLIAKFVVGPAQCTRLKSPEAGFSKEEECSYISREPLHTVMLKPVRRYDTLQLHTESARASKSQKNGGYFSIIRQRRLSPEVEPSKRL